MRPRPRVFSDGSTGLCPGKGNGMRLVTFERISNSGIGDSAAPVMPLFGVGAPMREEGSQETGGGPGTFSFFGEEVGILSADGSRILPVAETGISYPDMNTLIAEHTPQEMQILRDVAAAFDLAIQRVRERTGAARPEGSSDAKEEAKEAKEKEEEGAGTGTAAPVQAFPGLAAGTEAKILSPIPSPLQDVICLGLNYTEHVQEAAAYEKNTLTSKNDRFPVYFSKRVNRSPADMDPVSANADLVDSLDYEAELAVIIGKDVKNVSPEEAPGCIFGYTILNDFSARNLQTRHTQWYLGKSLDGYTPMGPCIVTADEFAFPPKRRIWSEVNGELRQDSTTDMLIFGIDHIIADLSRGMTLRAGTIISTGTPKGVGMGFDPPKFLQAGDTVTCGIEGIGTLTSRIVD